MERWCPTEIEILTLKHHLLNRLYDLKFHFTHALFHGNDICFMAPLYQIIRYRVLYFIHLNSQIRTSVKCLLKEKIKMDKIVISKLRKKQNWLKCKVELDVKLQMSDFVWITIEEGGGIVMLYVLQL